MFKGVKLIYFKLIYFKLKNYMDNYIQKVSLFIKISN